MLRNFVVLVVAGSLIPSACFAQNTGYVSVANCRIATKAKGYAGRFGWEDGPDRALVAFSESRTLGETALQCRLATGITSVTFGVIRISFQGKTVGGEPSGMQLRLRQGGQQVFSADWLRTAGEDWAESGERTIPINPVAGRVTLELRLADQSTFEAIRVDLSHVRWKR